MWLLQCFRRSSSEQLKFRETRCWCSVNDIASIFNAEPSRRSTIATLSCDALTVVRDYSVAIFLGVTVYSAGIAAAGCLGEMSVYPLLALPVSLFFNSLMAYPVALVLGACAWIFGWTIRVRNPSPWHMMTTGLVLGLLTYLTWVLLGVGTPSDRPMTFAENIRQPVHIFPSLLSICGGVVGLRVYRTLRRG